MLDLNDESKVRLRQGLFAVVAGILMLIGGFRGRAGGLLRLIIEATEAGLLPLEVSRFIGNIVVWLAFFGGVTVIFGGFLHFVKAPRFIASFFVSLGSGVSVFNLTMTLIASGPAVKLSLLKSSFSGLVYIGFDFALLLFASVFAFFALVNDPLGFILGMIAGTLVNLSGSLTEFKVITRFLSILGVSELPKLVANFLLFLFFSGVFFFVAGIFYGYNFYRLGIFFFALGFILFSLPVFILVLGFVFDLVNTIRLLFGLVGMFFAAIGLWYGFRKIIQKKMKSVG